MKRILGIILIMAITVSVFAQTQQGYVKTRGRMIDGRHVAGRGLTGASITIKGRNTVLSQEGGAFSFPVPAKTFHIQSVQKKGYQLVDADVTRKPYKYSANVLYIIMETPEQQVEDKLAAERKIRRTLQRQLQQREDELEDLKAQNKLSQEEYQKALQHLYNEQQDNEKLIADMAKEYAQIDYDQMDALNQRISDAIINGRLTEADSLLRSKGDINSRITKNKQKQAVESRRESELARQQAELEDSKAGTQQELEDIADDCYSFFNRFKLANQYDSAAYYIQLRAELDTTCAEWQHTAAYYLQTQKQYHKAETYYLRTLAILRNQDPSDSEIHNHNLALALINYGNQQFYYEHYKEAESLYQEAIGIIQQLSRSDSITYDVFVVGAKSDLASVYSHLGRFKESEVLNKEVLNTCKRLAASDSLTYIPHLANNLNNLGTLYSITSRYEESEAVYKEALEIYEHFKVPESERQRFDKCKGNVLHNLGCLYGQMENFDSGEIYFQLALDVRKQLAEINPQAYEPDLAQTMRSLGKVYYDTQQYYECETMYLGALEILRRLSRFNPDVYLPDLAMTLDYLYEFYSITLKFKECDSLYQEALDLYKDLARRDPQKRNSNMISLLKSQSFFLALFEKYADAERSAREILAINPAKHWIVPRLATVLLLQGKYAEAEKLYRQYKDELKDSLLFDINLFSEAGLITKHEKVVEKIKRMLNE